MIQTQASWIESASLYQCPYKSDFSFVKNPVYLKILKTIYFLKNTNYLCPYSILQCRLMNIPYFPNQSMISSLFFVFFKDILNTTIIWLYVMCKNSTMHSIIPQMFIESHISARNNGMRHFHILVGFNNH